MSYKVKKYISSLIQKKVQQNGGIKLKDLEKIARSCGVSLTEAFGVVSFMHDYPAADTRHTIKLCQGLPCYLKGGVALFSALQARLKLSAETLSSPDKSFGLKFVNCLGRCDNSPAMMVDDDIYVDVSADKLDKIFEKYN